MICWINFLPFYHFLSNPKHPNDNLDIQSIEGYGLRKSWKVINVEVLKPSRNKSRNYGQEE